MIFERAGQRSSCDGVEVFHPSPNPTSNMLISRMNHPFRQPWFHTHPADGSGTMMPPVPLSPDDPVRSATNADDEFAYAWATMVRTQDIGPRLASEVLEVAARASWRARFTLSQS